MWRSRGLEHVTWRSDLMRGPFGTPANSPKGNGRGWRAGFWGAVMVYSVLYYQDSGTSVLSVLGPFTQDLSPSSQLCRHELFTYKVKSGTNVTLRNPLPTVPSPQTPPVETSSHIPCVLKLQSCSFPTEILNGKMTIVWKFWRNRKSQTVELDQRLRDWEMHIL